jgi:hypothetical protein
LDFIVLTLFLRLTLFSRLLEPLLMTASVLSPCRQITAQVKEKVGEQDKKKRGGAVLLSLLSWVS